MSSHGVEPKLLTCVCGEVRRKLTTCATRADAIESFVKRTLWMDFGAEPLPGKDVDFTVEGVAEIVGDFGDVAVEQQITEFSETARGVSNAHAPLPAIFGLVG